MPAPTPIHLIARGRRPAALGRMADALAGRSLRCAETLQLWIERYRQRRALHKLSDHLLKDLGFTRADVWREGEKRFWKE